MNYNSTTTAEADIKAYALRAQRAYTKQYRETHPEQVRRWRQTAIINAYKKLIAEKPELRIEGGGR